MNSFVSTNFFSNKIGFNIASVCVCVCVCVSEGESERKIVHFTDSFTFL